MPRIGCVYKEVWRYGGECVCGLLGFGFCFSFFLLYALPLIKWSDIAISFSRTGILRF